jgi:hypothetical protein
VPLTAIAVAVIITEEFVVNWVPATTLIVPVIVNVFVPVIVAFAATVAVVVMEANKRETSMFKVPPSSIVIVFPAVIALALTVLPLVIVVCANETVAEIRRKLRSANVFETKECEGFEKGLVKIKSLNRLLT